MLGISKEIEVSKICLLGDRIAVKRDDLEQTVKSGLVIPESAQEKPLQGTVVAIGEGDKDKDGNVKPITNIKVDDKVLFQKWGGTEIKTDKGDVVIMSLKEIIAVIK